ncbi:PRTRC system ThiF family protein (plasmid) [Aliivibrio salmonicida]|uniref:PRTRC system ThiF family protein n=1 Tax=Aliivibrio salmonicida TaxID=40269 RepID=UPI000F71CC3E|nr:PRTRC system ThiF family protein [Aliivibrio salmonicida]AZL83405.1 PRTRC system ThiF family protein [Aliivibrio salmonicida]
MDKFILPSNFTGFEKRINIALVGAGGTGSAVLTGLFKLNTTLTRLGSKGLHVTVFDPKTVSMANIGRQAFWSDRDCGHYKSSLLVNRINQFGQLDWKAVIDKFDPSVLVSSFGSNNSFDLLITTVDSAKARFEIGSELARKKQSINAEQKQSLWLDIGNGKSVGQAVLGSMFNGDGTSTLPSPFQLFKNEWESFDDTKQSAPSCSTLEAISKQAFMVNDTVAISALSMILFPLLRNGEIKNHGVFINLDEATTYPLPISKESWAIYGFESK